MPTSGPIARNANYIIEGLSAENHAAYCRDALARVLGGGPEISGLTFRVHGESGVAEGSYDFWKTLFGAAKEAAGTIPLDLHAKGIDQQDDRYGALHRAAGEHLAEVHGGAHGAAVSAGGHSRTGDAAARSDDRASSR